MKKLVKHKSIRLTSALVAASTAMGFGVLALGPTAAHADPPYNNNGSNLVLAGVGSNTIEDIGNAWTGQEPTPGLLDSTGTPITPALYTPVADPLTGTRIYSFDAENPYDPFNTTTVGCTTTKLGGSSFDRPNGSGAGATALSDALIGGKTWYEGNSKGPGGCFGTAATAQNVSGQIDWARSSKQPSAFNATVATPADNGATDVAGNCGPSAPVGTNTSGPCLTYIAVGHDGVSYSYWAGGGTAVGNAVQAIPSSTLTSLYSAASGTVTVGGVQYFDCLSQLSSGTTGFFLGAISVAGATAQTSATANNCFGIEENSGNDFYTKALAQIKKGSPTATGPLANTVWVAPFSIGQWVAQNNGKAQDVSATARSSGITLGNPSGTATGPGTVNNQPFTGSGTTSEAADPTYESNATWGRDLWLVAPWYKIDDPAADVVQYAGIFGTTDGSFGIGTGGGAICAATAGAAQTLLNPFGFLTAAQVNAVRAGAANVCGTQVTIKNQNGHVS